MSAPDRLAHAERLLAEVERVDEARDLVDFAEAARVYARQMRLGLSAVNLATSVKLRAEMRLAEIIDAGQSAGTIATDGKPLAARAVSTLTELGVNRGRLAEARLLRHAFTPEDVVRAAADATERGRELPRRKMLGEAYKRRAYAERDATPPASTLSEVDGDRTGPGWRVALGDFADQLADLDEAVDLVVTDPPYADDALDLYERLAKWASSAVRPGGVVAVYAGTYRLPEVLDALRASDLTYRWTYSLDLSAGAQARYRAVNIIQRWKPIIVMHRPPWRPPPWGPDVLVSPGPEKDVHPWQQSGAPVRELIERYSAPGWVVADPFLGGGTTGYAALALDRQFIGADLDPACVQRFAP
jgi:site-specific DNA-methyltransferase (adenine-specific)